MPHSSPQSENIWNDWHAAVSFQERYERLCGPAADGAIEQVGVEQIFDCLEKVRSRPYPDGVGDAPEWLLALQQNFKQPSFDAGEDCCRLQGLLTIAEPTVRSVREFLRREIHRGGSILPNDEQQIGTLLHSIQERLVKDLFHIVSKSLAVEIGIGQEAGLLVGETSEERYQFFVRCLEDLDFAWDILARYPVMGRNIGRSVEYWKLAMVEFLQRLDRDSAALCETFFGNEFPGALSKVHSSGDTHCAGRSTLVLSFESGGQLMYKPRPLSVEAVYQEFLEWVNDGLVGPSLKTHELYDCGDYGWVEFVSRRDCDVEGEVTNFYWRQGVNLGLMYFLDCTDLHSENIIADGEHPVLVDLETLFHPEFGEASATHAGDLSNRMISRSVLKTFLLPRPVKSSAEETANVDLSGLSGEKPQMSPYEFLAWDDVGTDNMRQVMTRFPLSLEDNLPVLNGQRIGPSQYTEEIVNGFIQICTLIIDNRQKLLDETGPLHAFKGTINRLVFRASTRYAMLLQETYHPDLTEDALERDEFLAHELTEDVASSPWLEGLVNDEILDLQQLDIPYFQGVVGTQRVTSSRGNDLSIHSMPNSLHDCIERVATFGEIDLQRQVFLIRVALAKVGEAEVRPPNQDPKRVPTERSLDNEALLIANQIGDRLKKTAISSQTGTTWITAFPSGENLFPVSAGYDLYSGLPGIALSLAYLSKETGRADYAELAAGALAEGVRLFRNSETDDLSVGAFDGAGGLIYTLTHLGILFKSPSLLDDAHDMAMWTVEELASCPQIDVISGWSGFVAAALALHDVRPANSLLECADTAITRISDQLARAENEPAGSGTELAPVSLAHGRAGIAWAFHLYANATGKRQFADKSLALLQDEYETWLSLKGDDITGAAMWRAGSPSSNSVSWCHGPGGIILSALASGNKSVPWCEETLIEEIASAWVEGSTEAHLCQCHGDLSCFDLLQLSAEKGLRDLGEADNRRVSQLVQRAGCPELDHDQFVRIGIPGLMTGVSGVIYGLLRIASPASVPSLLTLSPPVKES